jgi:hypothetical protein
MSFMKLDILAFGAHPDDIELGCGGMLISEIGKGRRVGLVDLTYGELGSRGTVGIRKEEAQLAAGKMGAVMRINLGWIRSVANYAPIDLCPFSGFACVRHKINYRLLIKINRSSTRCSNLFN